MRFLLQILLCLHLLAPIAAFAQASATVAKDPLNYPLKQYAFLLGLAVLGGFVSWYTRVRKGEIAAWNVHHLIGELATSAFAGLIAFWLCEWGNLPPMLTAAIVGVSGHMGAKAINFVETRLKSRLDKALAIVTPPADHDKG